MKQSDKPQYLIGLGRSLMADTIKAMSSRILYLNSASAMK